MKKIFVITTALATSAAATPAIAADLAPRYSQPEPAYIAYAPLYNWTGFYVGGHLGGAFSGNNNFSAPFAHSNFNGRFLGGVQIGADYLFTPNWLVGVEGQYSWLSGRIDAVFPDGIAYTNNQSGLGSITGRFGYSWGPSLVYVKGGYAYSNNNESLTFSNLPVAFAIAGDHHNGWTVGAGLEFMLAPNWSGKIEYQYYNFGRATFLMPAIGNFTTDDSTVKLGVNYRFNWGVPFAVRY